MKQKQSQRQSQWRSQRQSQRQKHQKVMQLPQNPHRQQTQVREQVERELLRHNQQPEETQQRAKHKQRVAMLPQPRVPRAVKFLQPRVARLLPPRVARLQLQQKESSRQWKAMQLQQQQQQQQQKVTRLPQMEKPPLVLKEAYLLLRLRAVQSRQREVMLLRPRVVRQQLHLLMAPLQRRESSPQKVTQQQQQQKAMWHPQMEKPPLAPTEMRLLRLRMVQTVQRWQRELLLQPRARLPRLQMTVMTLQLKELRQIARTRLMARERAQRLEKGHWLLLVTARPKVWMKTASPRLKGYQEKKREQRMQLPKTQAKTGSRSRWKRRFKSQRGPRTRSSCGSRICTTWRRR